MPTHRARSVVSSVITIFALLCSASVVNGQVDFNRQVRPILAEHCFACHGPDAKKRSGELRLDVEADAKIAAIVAGAPDKSPLVARINTSDHEAIMPPVSTGKTLSSEQKETLKQWIREGAKYSSHWAFQPIGKAEDMLKTLPASELPDARTVDRFLQHRLQEAGLSYSPEISRAQFIRRATFDLTGLPPTWAEVEAYVNDASPDSTEKLIDRLLESPRYGERWGRHWLDIARYADTHGGAAIGFTTFPFSYTYRDYVIGAFNRDLSFDRFLQEQIAADQLGLSEDDPALAGLGFLTVGMQFRNYHDTIDDQIDVVTRGLMGLTVTCARCHDHKFDPIPTTDYYALYAAIAPSKAPAMLPVIGNVSDEAARQAYDQQLADLKLKYQQFAREQGEVLRQRLRMQVGLYLAEMAKGLGEQDTSTVFLSYRTDDIRPILFNHWRDYLASLKKDDPVFGPWLEMQSWGPMPEDEFRKRCEEYIGRLSAELDAAGRTPDKLHALRGEPPKWNPFVIDALSEKKPKSLLEVAAIYGHVFAAQQKQWQQALMETATEATPEGSVLPDDHPAHLVINSPSHRQIRHHLFGEGTPFDLTDEEAIRLTNRTISDLANGKKGAIHGLNLSAPGSPPRAMAIREEEKPKETHVLLRGNPLARGEIVKPHFLSVLPGADHSTYQDGQRRLGLARSIISDSNPLTARVLVNWAWQNHFGVGLVRTPDDFGVRGQPPTHPELLDYLADEFRRNGWSLKWLHRQIMLSQAYRQGAVENEKAREIDPENLRLWRMPRRRLDFEAMRDSMLSVCEELDMTMGGRPIDLNASPAVPRRSVYGFVNRDIIANLMSTFDTANPNACTARRPETTVPQQTLFALNSDFIQDRATKLAALTRQANPTGDDQRIVDLVRRALCRTPSDEEVRQAAKFLGDSASDPASANDPERRWVLLAHALLASNEFTFLD
ncbi:MAG: PSD1 domain-containing protein [Planctomycetaceae bacterium]|nr:PSD1 domain-containing protein [Planctomycetaceae bacterium]